MGFTFLPRYSYRWNDSFPITNGGSTTLRRKNLRDNQTAVSWERDTFDGQPVESKLELTGNDSVVS